MTEVVGRDGITLEDAWAERPNAYLSISIPHFPNLFLLNGPNGPVGNFSLITIAEMQLHYVLQLVEELRRGRAREIGASQAAMERFSAEFDVAARKTIWASGYRSWYLDSRGIPAVWPFTYQRFVEALNVPVLANITEFGATPLFSRDELASVGVAIQLYPLSAFRAMNKAAEAVYTAIRRDGHQKNVVDLMQTRDELYDRIGYHEFESQLDALFSQGKSK